MELYFLSEQSNISENKEKNLKKETNFLTLLIEFNY